MHCYIPINKLVIDYSVRDLCKTPYPNHPKGCPNYGRENRPFCPPRCPRIEDYYDLTQGLWFVWTRFNFKDHVARMAEKHPTWTTRQKECCLYWQGTANKNLKQNVQSILDHFKVYDTSRVLTPAFCPEAMGINVTATMKNISRIINFDCELEWPPKNIVRKVAIIGVRKN